MCISRLAMEAAEALPKACAQMDLIEHCHHHYHQQQHLQVAPQSALLLLLARHHPLS